MPKACIFMRVSGICFIKSQIALEATEMGRTLYEKYGFVKMEDEMELIK